MRCGNNCCKDYIDNLYTWLIELMLNYSSECYSYTEEKFRVQWSPNLKELKKKEIDAHSVWESGGKPNAGLINDKCKMQCFPTFFYCGQRIMKWNC